MRKAIGILFLLALGMTVHLPFPSSKDASKYLTFVFQWRLANSGAESPFVIDVSLASDVFHVRHSFHPYVDNDEGLDKDPILTCRSKKVTATFRSQARRKICRFKTLLPSPAPCFAIYRSVTFALTDPLPGSGEPKTLFFNQNGTPYDCDASENYCFGDIAVPIGELKNALTEAKAENPFDDIACDQADFRKVMHIHIHRCEAESPARGRIPAYSFFWDKDRAECEAQCASQRKGLPAISCRWTRDDGTVETIPIK